MNNLFFSKKNILIFFFLTIFLLSFLINFSYGAEKDRIKGWAWSENIGWISLNCSNTDYCNEIDYGVTILSTGYLSGYAWSENIGWIDFSSYGDAFFNSNTGDLSGSVRVVSGLEDSGDDFDGRISLSGSNYGLSLDLNTYEIEGWAWGSEVLGWISFNCSNENSCSSSNYSSTYDPFYFDFTASAGLSLNDEADYQSDVTLSWETEESVTSCLATGGSGTEWTDEQVKTTGYPTISTFTISEIEEDNSFSLECQNAAGFKIQRDLDIFVKPPAPIVSISSDDNNINYGGSIKLTWTALHVGSCEASGSWTGSKSIGENITEDKSNLTNFENYYLLTCISSYPSYYPDSVSASVLVNVEKLEVDFYADKEIIPYNDPVILNWRIDYANSCSISGDWDLFDFPTDPYDPDNPTYEFPISAGNHTFETGIKNVEGEIFSYTLTCSGTNGQTYEETINVKVGENPIFREN